MSILTRIHYFSSDPKFGNCKILLISSSPQEYFRISSHDQVRTNQEAGLTEDQERTVSFTVDEMREFLRKLSRNNNFAAGREIKWGV